MRVEASQEEEKRENKRRAELLLKTSYKRLVFVMTRKRLFRINPVFP